MHLIVTKDYAALSLEAARQSARSVARKPTAAVAVATGNSPIGAYKRLAVLKEQGKFDPSRWKIYQLDEYLGLPADDPRTLWGWMERDFITPLGLSAADVVRFHTDTTDAHATCQAYDAAVDAVGGFDLSILGLGPWPGGHLGFNEAPCKPTDNSRIVVLPEASLVSNGAYWGGRDRVPPQAMTAGMKQLLGSKHILLLVSGPGKRAILKRALTGPVNDQVTASYLQLHANVTVIADRDAAGDLYSGVWPRV
jgi:glucosamine-6-phosphate deaminase